MRVPGHGGSCKGGVGVPADYVNAAQLPAGMFADCHFYLTCSFSLGVGDRAATFKVSPPSSMPLLQRYS